MEVRQLTPTGSFAALPSIRARSVSVLNNSGAALELRRTGTSGSDEKIVLKDGQSVELLCEMQASEWEMTGSGTSTELVSITFA